MKSIFFKILSSRACRGTSNYFSPRSQVSLGNALVCALLWLGFLSDFALAADPPAADPIAEALPVLQAKYPDFPALHYKPGDHLSDLIARSGGKISLSAPPVRSAPRPIVTANLPGNILYWRLASFTPEKSWLETGAQLQQAASATRGVVLDLRSTIAPDDYRGAAQVLGFFAPNDATRFRFPDTNPAGRSGDGPVRLLGGTYSFSCPLVVLINNQTTGAAEALAACLKADGALVMGQATAGRMGVFEEQKLSTGQVLRYFVSPVGFEEDSAGVFKIPHHSLPWGQPVTPDIAVTVNERAEKAALMLIRDHHILDVIQESAERHRMNEAALVQGEDPEWDAYLASLEKKPFLLSLPAIHDVVLIRALDSLKAIRLSQRQAAPPSKALPQTSLQ